MIKNMYTIHDAIKVTAQPEQATVAALNDTNPNQASPERAMLTINETADRLTRDGYGIKAYTLKRWTRDGTLHCVYAGRKALLYYPAVLQFLTGGASA